MKRWSKILVTVLTLVMIVPMLTELVPLQVNAEDEAIHEVYLNKFDFEDAEVGKNLTADYLNRTVADGFTTTKQSGVDTELGRNPESYTVVSETVNGVTNKYIQPHTPTQAAMPTIYDQTGLIWKQPYELSFKIKGEKGSWLREGAANSGYNYGALIAVSTKLNATGGRQSLLYARDLNLNWSGGGSNKICGLAKNQWHEITAKIDPLTGKIDLRIEQLTFDENGTKMSKGGKGTANEDGTVITSSVTVSSLVTSSNEGLISLGRFYGEAAVDFCFDDISLCSYIDEHIDFTDAQIETVPAQPESVQREPLGDYISGAVSNNTSVLFSGSADSNTIRDTYFSLVEETDGNTVLKHRVTSSGKTAGLRIANSSLFSTTHEVSLSIKYVGHTSGKPLNVIRYGKGDDTSVSGLFAPLAFKMNSGKMYAGTNVNMYALLQKVDGGYGPIEIVKNEWYEFKAIVDPAAKTYQVLMRTEENGEWQTLRFIKDAPKTSTYTAFADEAETVDTAQFSWFDSTLANVTCVWIAHGTADAWSSNCEWYVDDISVKTQDGTTVNESIDFEAEKSVTTPATPEIPAKTDWWVNDTFQNADGKQGGAKLTDFKVVDAPKDADKYGKVIQPKGTLGAFCFNDTKDLLTKYIFDVSYDFYMTTQPTSNILMLKLWAPYNSSSAAAMNTLVLEGGKFLIFDQFGTNSRRQMDVPTTAATNTWYNIRTRFNLTEGYYWVYINDILVHTQDISEVYPELDPSAFHNIHFGIHTHYSSSVKAYHYLDNIKVNTVEPIVKKGVETAEVIGVQQSKNSNSIRVLAGVNSLNYGNVGFTFELLSEDGSGWIKVYDRITNTVYTEITADGEKVTAREAGSKYFIMAVISDIDSDGVLCIRPYTTKDTVRNYGEEAIYSLKVDDGSLSIKPTTISGASLSEDYKVFIAEGYEEARDKFSNYNATPSETDTNEYRLGGEMLSSNSVFVGATTKNARTGQKAMAIEGIAPTTSGKFSARIKLNNLMPFNISEYANYDVKISAYVKLTDVANPTKDVSIRLGLMGERNNTELVYATTAVHQGEWTLIEYEGRISEDLLTKLGEGYPARVFIGLGSTTSYAQNIYVDDMKVEFKPSVGVSLPSIFADGMVLQRNKPVNVWGWAGLAGDRITATVADKSGATLSTASATVDQNGEFIVTLPQMAAATDCTLTVTNNTAGSSISYSNVGIGEVWFCSGQSNMQLSMAKLHNTEDIIADANNRDIRAFKVEKVSSYTLKNDVKGSWKTVTADNVSSVSGIAYVTAYNLQKTLDVPVAVIECHLGSSSANAWLSYRKMFAEDRADIYNNPDWIPRNEDGSLYTASSGGLEGKTMYEDYNYYWQVGTANEGSVRNGEHGNTGSIFAPTGLYNGMQGPLANFAVAGVMWYQGEARTNSLRAEEYNYILNDLIEQWREDFCDDELPVLIFQLAPYPSSPYYSNIRQTQLDVAKRNDHVYAITTAYEGPVYSKASGGSCLDLDGGNSIHPGTKVPVATRAAYTILACEHGLVDQFGAYLSPEYQTMTVLGNVATLTFSNANGLTIRSGDEALTGFRAYAVDGTELTVVSAVIDGSTVVVTTAEGTSPISITYAIDNATVRQEIHYPSLTERAETQYLITMTGNLENAMGQPAIPFMASLSDVSIYDVSAKDGKLTVEIRELGHLVSTYKVVVDVNGTTAEYTASFATSGNYVINNLSVSAGDSVTVTLKTVDGETVESKTLSVQ